MNSTETQILLEMTKMALEHRGSAAIIIAGAVALVLVVRLGFRWKAKTETPTKPEKPKRPKSR